MDRQTIYAGQIPLDTDQLLQSQNTMVALAKLCAAVLGTNTIVNGFTCVPTTPASLNVNFTAGEIYQIENLEATNWTSSVPANTAFSIVKQGIQLSTSVLGITPPGGVGFSQVFLVEVQYSDLDTGTTLLPYFNSAAPSNPFMGPGNSGTSQNTVRKGTVAVQVKAGIAAATGTQVAPTADAGWTGLFTITVANGQSTITSGSIAQLPFAPFIPATLPAVPGDVQAGAWVYAVDIGITNAMVATVSPAVAALVPGMRVSIKAAAGNTGPATLNLNGLGNYPIHRANGAVLASGDYSTGQVIDLVFDGSAWQTSNYFGFSSTTTNNNTFTTNIPQCTDTSGAANSIVAPFSPSITSLTTGLAVIVKLANSITGPTTITVNALAPVPVISSNLTALATGSGFAGEELFMIYDGANFQVVNWRIPPSALEFTLDGAGAPLTGNSGNAYGFLVVPFNCTLNSLTALADQVGSVTLNVCRWTPFSNFNPSGTTGGSTITPTPTISAAAAFQTFNMTGYSTTLLQGDVLGFFAGAATNIQRVTVSLGVTRS